MAFLDSNQGIANFYLGDETFSEMFLVSSSVDSLSTKFPHSEAQNGSGSRRRGSSLSQMMLRVNAVTALG